MLKKQKMQILVENGYVPFIGHLYLLLLGKEFLHATKFVNYEKFQTHEACFFFLPPLVAILCSSLSSSIFHSRGGW